MIITQINLSNFCNFLKSELTIFLCIDFFSLTNIYLETKFTVTGNYRFFSVMRSPESYGLCLNFS